MDLVELSSFPPVSERRLAIVGGPTKGNVGLVDGLRRLGYSAALVDPFVAADLLAPGDVALGRLDVLQTLDGIEPGLDELLSLLARGVVVLNQPTGLLRAHDKLLTGIVLTRHRIPYPRTQHLVDPDAPVRLDPPVVLKPRFGSWGRDVVLCETRRELSSQLNSLRDRPWFRAHGVLVQELVSRERRDVRIVVAGDSVVGAIERVASGEEWRTNVAVGARRVPLNPDPEARRLAVAAASALKLDLVGVDLLRGPAGYVVLELNGAVDFDGLYSLPGRDVYADLARSLELAERQPKALSSASISAKPTTRAPVAARSLPRA